MKSQILTKEHNRADFTCGNDILDRYLVKFATQDNRRGLSVCYVITEDGRTDVLAYYTLSSSVIERSDVPEEYTKLAKVPYTDLPVFIIGRLAVHKNYQGKGLGGATLISAFRKALHVKEQIGCCAVVVDPKDEYAERFYERYGFVKLLSSNRMFLPMATIEQLMKSR